VTACRSDLPLYPLLSGFLVCPLSEQGTVPQVTHAGTHAGNAMPRLFLVFSGFDKIWNLKD